jgi:hypothetical protein
VASSRRRPRSDIRPSPESRPLDWTSGQMSSQRGTSRPDEVETSTPSATIKSALAITRIACQHRAAKREPIRLVPVRTGPYDHGHDTPSDLHSRWLARTATDFPWCFARRGSIARPYAVVSGQGCSDCPSAWPTRHYRPALSARLSDDPTSGRRGHGLKPFAMSGPTMSPPQGWSTIKVPRSSAAMP